MKIGTKVKMDDRMGEVYYIEERPTETLFGIEFEDGSVEWLKLPGAPDGKSND